MRPRGTGSLFDRGGIWWIKFHKGGKSYRESSKSSNRKDAEKLLRTRLYEAANDLLRRKQKVTVEILIQAVVDEAVTMGHHSVSSTKGRAKNDLIPALGSTLASELTTADIRGYIKARRKKGAADATINRELAILRRAYRLGMAEKACTSMPYIPRLDESKNVRQGYLEHADYLKLRGLLPKGMDLLLVIGYHVGRRLGELRQYTWSMVDLKAKEIRVPAGITKSKRAETIPIYEDMGPYLAAAKAERDELFPEREWVFMRHGKRIGAGLAGWREACKKAKVPNLLFHDLRRSAVRNMERAGMPRTLAMRISGHLTEAMYRRYAIASESDKSLATDRMEKYFGLIQKEQQENETEAQGTGESIN